MKSEAKRYEVMRQPKSTLMESQYRAGMNKEHTRPTVFTKFFQLEVIGQAGVSFEDKAVVNIAKDIDATISKLLSQGGVYTELFKDIKSSKGNYPLTVVAENGNNLNVMRKGWDSGGKGGHFSRETNMNITQGTKRVPFEQVVLILNYDKDGRPLFRPYEHKHVLIHEFIHKMDLITSTRSASVKKLVTALRTNPIYTSSYSHTNDKEMIAELLAFYFVKSDFTDYSEQFKQLEDVASSIGVKLSRK